MYGSDAFNALEPDEFRNMVNCLNEAQIIIKNDVNKNNLRKLRNMKVIFEKSIVIKRKIKKNQIIEFDDLTFKKPGYGISPRKYKQILGKRAKKNLKEEYILKIGDYY
jgi:sialic acid synthase SpsE